MKRYFLLTGVIVNFLITSSFSQNNDSAIIRSFYNEALTNGKAYGWLKVLTTEIGPRLSGSTQAANAVKWSEMLFNSLKLDRVVKQKMMVPHWVRGPKEKAYIIKGEKKTEVPVCALGGSIATPKNGLTAEVVEVRSFDELNRLGNRVAGKIVFFNFSWDQTKINTFEAYGDAVAPRGSGAQKAAPFGAVGVVVRSAGSSHDDFPHTGAMGYNDTITKIPACAISTNGADMLSRLLKLKSMPPVKFSFNQHCKMLPDTVSFNVIGEIKGSEYPDEIITIGGHLDSWDLGQGAHDDGAGVVQCAEVLNLFRSLNIQPKRTIRCVFFMNEENGGRGGKTYAEECKKANEKLIAALETDAGGFTPRGFGFSGDSVKVAKLRGYKKLFEPYNLYSWDGTGGGADIGHLADQCPVMIGLSPDSQRYFELHHTAADTFDKVNQRELELGAASIASLVYLIAEHGF